MKTSLWKIFFRNIITSKTNVFALSIVLCCAIVALFSYWGIIAYQWNEPVGPSYMPPSWQHWFGTDTFGLCVGKKIIKGTEYAMRIGFVVSMVGIAIGLVLGLIAGYFGGVIDECIVWLYSTVTAIPNFMLLISLVFVLGKGIVALYIAMGFTSWVGVCRLIRGEVIKHKNKEYILAASALGAGHCRKLFYHILPNVFHVVIIQFALIFQMAVKSEVILSYLGLGIQNAPSWGIMIDDAKVELSRGVWWPLFFATLAMFLVVVAFNLLSDTLRDTLDPKLKSR